MRHWWGAFAVSVVCLITTTGCTREVTGLPRADPNMPGTALSTDGYGVMVGSADAAVQLEIFIEPQCPHCAEFESSYGDKISSYLGSGRLAVTYRPLTFLDDAKDNDYSARVSNALFLAAGHPTTATAYQAFLDDLYRHQDLYGDGPESEDMAAMARDSGVPDEAAERIAAGDSGVDTVKMDDANAARLKDASPDDPGTPTVYDLKLEDVIDPQDSGWLDKLFKSA